MSTGGRHDIFFAALAGTALLLLFTSAAAAQSQIFVTDAPFAPSAPAPAGDSVIWGERSDRTTAFSGNTMRLRSLAASGSVGDIGSVDVGYDDGFLLKVVAGEGRIAYWRADARCVAECRLVESSNPELYFGPIGGPYEPVPNCYTYSAGVFAGGYFSFSDYCNEERVVTRDLTTGAEYTFEPMSGSWQHKGRYVAVSHGDLRAWEISVHNVATGDELYRVAGAGPKDYDVDEAGTLVLYEPRSGEFSSASPQQPAPKVFAHIQPDYREIFSYVRFTIRRGIVAATSSPDVSRNYLIDLAGNTASYEQRESVGEWGFDGRRLAWWSRPCELAILQVWDPLDGPPTLADEACPWARLGETSTRVNRRGKIFVDARCPLQPQLGCTGMMRLVAERSRHRLRRTLGEPTYEVPSGETERLELRLSRESRRFIRRRGRVRVTAVSRAVARHGSPWGRDGRPRGERRRFRFELTWRG